MKKYTRKINLGQVIELAGLLKASLDISGIDKVVIAQVKNRLAKGFSEEQDAFNTRLEGVRKKLKDGEGTLVSFTEDEKKKKAIEFTKAELSAIGRAFVSLISDKEKGTIETVGAILQLSADDCLMLERYIKDNFPEDKMEFIDLKEDENLIPDE